MNSNMMVTKSNVLVQASYSLSLLEQRLLLLCITKARDMRVGFDTLTPVEITAAYYASTFDVPLNEAYKALKTACLNIFQRQFTFFTIDERGKKTTNHARWVQRVSYTEGSATAAIIFSVDVAPLITRLQENFTSYMLHNVSKLKNGYAIRLYELLMQWQTTKKLMVNIDDLRIQLGALEPSYKSNGIFKAKVVDRAVGDLNKSTNISVTATPYKVGRAIKGFTFTYTFVDEAKGSQVPVLTERQCLMYGTKLSMRSELSDLADVGESQDDFAERLADMLRDPKFVKKHLALLKTVGFK